ncbi:MAG: exosortase/archaeosortase family protein [candidate division KSB1 bacterium]|nr:exosortase/archaeosortase family protein [candidate division KSB1 bacterium]
MPEIKSIPDQGYIHDNRVFYLIGLIALLFVITFYAPMRELYRDWSIDPNYSHGFLIPVISMYFLWLRRHDLPRNQNGIAWPGIGIMLIGMIGAVLGSAAAEWFMLRSSMALFLHGMVLYAIGWGNYKRIWFPMNYLWLMIPLPYVVYYAMTFPLQRLSTYLAYQIITAMGIASIIEGNILRFANFSLEVIEACSGLRSIMVLLALSAPIAYMSSLRLPCKFILFFSAIPIAIIVNSFRLVLTALMGLFGNPESIDDVLMHQGAGVMVFILGLAFVLMLNRIFLWINHCEKPA